MLTDFAALRTREFSRLDASGETYLDYTGAALYAESVVRAHAEWLQRGVYGNPHSEHRPSRRSAEVMEQARQAVLDFLDAPADEYDVCLTANASAAIKLVAESYPFGPDCGAVLTADNHNSVNGITEYVRSAGGRSIRIPLDRRLQLVDAGGGLADAKFPRRGLFAFPAQSNFSGIRHPLTLVAEAKALGFDVLLDAAAYVPTATLSLRHVPADFVALSLYKITGYPTGVGALVARRSALVRLRRPWFAGGTVQFASVEHRRFAWRDGAEGFEDGTPDFLSLAAVAPGLAWLTTVDRVAVSEHVNRLARRMRSGLTALRYGDGRPVVACYGEAAEEARGNTVAFNLRGRTGIPVPYRAVETRLADDGVAIRGGCFCNPGAAEAAFGWPATLSGRCLGEVGAAFSVERFSACVGGDYPVGALRASVGIATNEQDVTRLLNALESAATDLQRGRPAAM